mgnify:CR=1 FL=1
MAHFAKISENNEVLQVLTLGNGDMLNADGVEDESLGQQYLELHNNWPAEMWIQTSYNTLGSKHSSGDNSKALRGNYACIGFEWDEDNQIFWPKKPFASWVKDTSDARWHSPIGDAPDLTDEEKAANTQYVWNEDGQSWDLILGSGF